MAGTLALVASLLVVPVVGGVTELWELRGDTPAQEAPFRDAATAPADRVSDLGTVDITASDATREGIYAHVPVGGISGIDCVDAGVPGSSGDSGPGTAAAVPGSTLPCLAVSDDPGQRGPVRAYPFDPASGQVGAPVVLTDTRGVPYRPGTVAPESIRLADRGRDAALVWSAEGTPTVTVADLSGRARYTLPVPAGIRRNQGLEGLAVAGPSAGSGERIITATEAAPAGREHPVITVRDIGDGGTSTDYAWPGTGVSEILVEDAGTDGTVTLLVLERGYTDGTGNSAVLWRTTLDGAGGLLDRQPVADLGALLGAQAVGNTEALAWAPDSGPDSTPDSGPDSGQGRRRVLLVGTDDNFSAGQRGVLHRIALDTPPRR